MRSISLRCLAFWIRFPWIALHLIGSSAFRSSQFSPVGHHVQPTPARSPSTLSTTTARTMVARAVDLVSGDLSWNTLLGEADRAFRWGTQLEKNGQARKASAAFHEACTLYQCFLDSRGEFAHVTSLPESECASVLAYACLRLGFLNQDALGDANAAVRLYKESAIIDPIPSAVSYDGMGESLEASGAGTKLREASDAYRKALQVSPDKRPVQFRLAVALERLGEPEEAERLFEILRRSESTYSCLVDSWGYVRWHTRNIPCRALNLYRGTRDTLELALTAAMPLIDKGGLVCEFGVGSGRSLRMAQEILPLDATLHGFDTVRRRGHGRAETPVVAPVASFAFGRNVNSMCRGGPQLALTRIRLFVLFYASLGVPFCLTRSVGHSSPASPNRGAPSRLARTPPEASSLHWKAGCTSTRASSKIRCHRFWNGPAPMPLWRLPTSIATCIRRRSTFWKPSRGRSSPGRSLCSTNTLVTPRGGTTSSGRGANVAKSSGGSTNTWVSVCQPTRRWCASWRPRLRGCS